MSASGRLWTPREVQERLVAWIREETGIQLHEEDVELDAAGGVLRWRFEGETLAEVEPSEEADADDAATELMEAGGDLRERLGEIRLERIRAALPRLGQNLRDGLVDAGWREEDAAELSVELWIDPWDEGSGWPHVEVEVGHPERGSVRAEANVFYPDDPVEPEELVARVQEELGG